MDQLKKKKIRVNLKFLRKNITYRSRIVANAISEYRKMAYVLLENGELRVCKFPSFDQVSQVELDMVASSSQVVYMRMHEEFLIINNQGKVIFYDCLMDRIVRCVVIGADLLAEIGTNELQVIPLAFCNMVYMLLCQSNGSVGIAKFESGSPH